MAIPTTNTTRGSSRARRLAVLGGPATRPISGRRWFPLYGLLHHVGRKSGRVYTTPVVIRAAPPAVFVPLPFGEHTEWYRNAQAAGGVRATWRGRVVWLAKPSIIEAQAAGSAFHPAMRALMRLAGIEQVVRFDSLAAETD